jgi:hypothetical protein
MHSSTELHCDGCGQPASAEHIARRLKRLENMTRYRPVHIQALLLGVASPPEDSEHLYSTGKEFQGEGAEALRAFGVDPTGRSVAETLANFQRLGLLLTHVLECPVSDAVARREALQRRMPGTLARIRRSYKPKRVVLVGAELSEFVAQMNDAQLNALLLLQNGHPYEWTGLSAELLGKEAAAPVAL